jgi:predicted RNA binding protein YcfA (HicA-like mRNA interferase family)
MKLSQISGLKLIKILNKFGFQTIRQRGSHIRLEKKIDDETIKLTVPLHHKLKKGTILSIIKSSKINEKEFEQLL